MTNAAIRNRWLVLFAGALAPTTAELQFKSLVQGVLLSPTYKYSPMWQLITMAGDDMRVLEHDVYVGERVAVLGWRLIWRVEDNVPFLPIGDAADAKMWIEGNLKIYNDVFWDTIKKEGLLDNLDDDVTVISSDSSDDDDDN